MLLNEEALNMVFMMFLDFLLYISRQLLDWYTCLQFYQSVALNNEQSDTATGCEV